MVIRSPYVLATITTIVSTVFFSIVQYYRNNLEIIEIAVFAVVFWIFFFFSQKYFGKK